MTEAETIAALAELDDAGKWRALKWLMSDLNATRPSEPKPQPAAERNYTVEEVAVLVQYHPSHVYELIKGGALKHWREGKLIRVTQAALDEFITQREMRGPLPARLSDTANIMLVSKCDRGGSETAATTAPAHASPTRGATRRSRADGCALGNRPSKDS
ncbi:MAG: helix-turn-helix domain-containing protein [Deltaproteobacteria bacterium]|nr:helix-turn-helix domain-containing protein [Deltaproteobacteria bacterium]